MCSSIRWASISSSSILAAAWGCTTTVPALSNSESSVNYSIQEYVNDVVSTFVDAADKHGFQHPNIITETGRSLTATITPSVISRCWRRASLPQMDDDWEPGEDAHELVKELYDIWDNLSQRSMLELGTMPSRYARRALDLFSHGIVDLNTPWPKSRNSIGVFVAKSTPSLVG